MPDNQSEWIAERYKRVAKVYCTVFCPAFSEALSWQR
jgi:hypothetical protein